MKEETQKRIAEMRQRWQEQRDQQEQARRAEETREMLVNSARAKTALENGWVPGSATPCNCDQFLAAILEGKIARCAHYDGYSLDKFLEQAGY